MINLIKRFVIRIKWKIARRSNPRIMHEERCLMIIIKKLLNIQDSELLMKPGMNKAYIKSSDGQIFVCVDFNNRVASVINHKFGYDIYFSPRVSNYIDDNFSNEVDKRRTEMENEYRGNVRYSLTNVIHNLTNNEKVIDSKQMENA